MIVDQGQSSVTGMSKSCSKAWNKLYSKCRKLVSCIMGGSCIMGSCIMGAISY